MAASLRSSPTLLALVGVGTLVAAALYALATDNSQQAPTVAQTPDRLVTSEVAEPQELVAGEAPSAATDPGEPAMRKIVLDKEIAGNAGLLGALPDDAVDGDDGRFQHLGDVAGADIATNSDVRQLNGGIGGLIGAKGTQVGSGGLGTRGSGLGGGGTAEGHGAVGTQGRGAGASGYGSGGGSFGAKAKREEGRVVANGAAARPPRSTEVTASPSHATVGTERSIDYGTNPLTLVEKDPFSTFAIDVDTASYTLARSSLNAGSLPNAASVRVEELVNFVPYDYVGPTGDAPFAVNMEAAPNPWTENHHLLRVGIQGRTVDAKDRKPAHLTFLVDVSGSMSPDNRLGMARRSLAWLVDNLGPEDTVAICTYAGRTEVVLDPTPVSRAEEIKAALDGLRSGGGTAMGSGIEMAYDLASDAYVEGAENRVIVLSDGDANIGRTSHDQILASIAKHAGKGITLSTIGFGRGNYQDTMMEQLADKGDGNYYYIDSWKEAERVFGQNVGGTIQTIARDVKIQVEFNPRAVTAYRLVGYENRDVADKDFRNDKVDGGEIGSGHSVTAIYDVILRDGFASKELATVKLRAKKPGRDVAAEEWSTTFRPRFLHDELGDASADFRMAVGTAAFAELMRGSPHVEELTYTAVWDIVAGAQRKAHASQDAELLALIERAATLTGASIEGVASR